MGETRLSINHLRSARVRRAPVRIAAALLLPALIAGCGADNEPTRPTPSRPPAERPATPAQTTEHPAPPAVPDGGLDRGHGVDDP